MYINYTYNIYYIYIYMQSKQSLPWYDSLVFSSTVEARLETFHYIGTKKMPDDIDDDEKNNHACNPAEAERILYGHSLMIHSEAKIDKVANKEDYFDNPYNDYLMFYARVPGSTEGFAYTLHTRVSIFTSIVPWVVIWVIGWKLSTPGIVIFYHYITGIYLAINKQLIVYNNIQKVYLFDLYPCQLDLKVEFKVE